MSVEELDGPQLRDLVESETRGVVVDFWSPWCAPCRALRPHLNRLADEHPEEWRFVAVNTEKHPGVGEAYGVRSLPTVVWFRAGREVSRLDGGVTLSSVAAKLDELQ